MIWMEVATMSPRSSIGRRLVVCGLAVLVVAWLLAGDVTACPNCKDAVDTSDPDGLNLARGYFYSILIMLAMPFTLAGSFGCYVWREMRRQRLQQAASGEIGPDARA